MVILGKVVAICFFALRRYHEAAPAWLITTSSEDFTLKTMDRHELTKSASKHFTHSLSLHVCEGRDSVNFSATFSQPSSLLRPAQLSGVTLDDQHHSQHVYYIQQDNSSKVAMG